MYYQGLAYKKLGKTQEANAIFNDMLKHAYQKVERNNFFNQFERAQMDNSVNASNHYMAGLAYLGLDKTSKAKEEFATTQKLLPSHVWSKVLLANMK